MNNNKYMKRILTGILGILGFVGMTGCEKEQAADGGRQSAEREIFYTVSDGTGMSVLEGTTVQVTSEEDFDTLLDRFCNYAEEGEQVMFCGNRQDAVGSKGNASDTPTSITTTDREELKAWMKEMEKAGKTVRVTYDDNNGTWSGTAYANLGEGPVEEARMYTGTLTFVPTPLLEEPPLGGLVWAMQVGNDSTLIITVHGMMMWNENDTPDENMQLLEGATMSFEGVASTHRDLNGEPFMTLNLRIE